MRNTRSTTCILLLLVLIFSLWTCIRLIYPLSARGTYASNVDDLSAPYQRPPEEIDAPNFPPISEFNSIITHPLFFSSRRPSSTETYHILLGTLLTGYRKVAILERRSDGTLLRLYEGDPIGNSKIVSIDANSVTLINKGQLYTIMRARMREGRISGPDSDAHEIDAQADHHGGPVEGQEVSEDIDFDSSDIQEIDVQNDYHGDPIDDEEISDYMHSDAFVRRSRRSRSAGGRGEAPGHRQQEP
jgi:hypothetical protein